FYTKIGFKALQANNPYILLMLILLLCPLFLQSQELPVRQSLNIEAEQDSTDIPVSEILLDLAIKDSVLQDSIVQDSISRDSISKDSVVKKKNFLDDQIKYKAKDYQKTVRSENTIYLYNEAEVYYQDTELK